MMCRLNNLMIGVQNDFEQILEIVMTKSQKLKMIRPRAQGWRLLFDIDCQATPWTTRAGR